MNITIMCDEFECKRGDLTIKGVSVAELVHAMDEQGALSEALEIIETLKGKEFVKGESV